MVHSDSSTSSDNSFPLTYYSKLCNSYSLESFYAKDAHIYMNNEVSTADKTDNSIQNVIRSTGVVEGLLTVHARKKVIKVIISIIDRQKLLYPDSEQKDKECSLINVVGQFVYHDNTTQRFSHVFVYKNIIYNEILTILDEEIIYKNLNLKNKIGNNLHAIRIKSVIKNNNKNKILNDFSNYGNIVALEQENNDLILEYESEENVKNINQEMNTLRQRGYRIEFCCERVNN